MSVLYYTNYEKLLCYLDGHNSDLIMESMQCIPIAESLCQSMVSLLYTKDKKQRLLKYEI